METNNPAAELQKILRKMANNVDPGSSIDSNKVAAARKSNLQLNADKIAEAMLAHEISEICEPCE